MLEILSLLFGMYKEPFKLRGLRANMGHSVCGLHELLLAYVDTNVTWAVEGEVGFLSQNCLHR